MNKKIIQERIQSTISTLSKISSSDSYLKTIEEIVELLSKSLKNGNKIITCGNGGSLCDSMHFAQELTGRFIYDRRPLPAISINDPSHMSCVSNDYDYSKIFSRSVSALGNEGDVLLAYSTSGNSPNVLEALKEARSKNIHTILLSGKEGGEGKNLSDCCLVVPSHSTSEVQEAHTKITHILIEGIERNIFSDLYKN